MAENQLGSTRPRDLWSRIIDSDLFYSFTRNPVVVVSAIATLVFFIGAGFAPFRGGPMQYARERGHEDVNAALEKLAAKIGPRFVPDEGWKNLG